MKKSIYITLIGLTFFTVFWKFGFWVTLTLAVITWLATTRK